MRFTWLIILSLPAWPQDTGTPQVVQEQVEQVEEIEVEVDELTDDLGALLNELRAQEGLPPVPTEPVLPALPYEPEVPEMLEAPEP